MMALRLRYLSGAVPAALRRYLLSRPWFPLLRTFQMGEEWAYDVCRFAGTRDLPVVFDVGAHVGETSLYLCRFFPHSQIHAFEFVPETARRLQANVQSWPNIRVHIQALGGTSETLQVPLQAFSKVNSLRFASPSAVPGIAMATLTVAVTTLDAFCAARSISRIDLLKIDAEGLDLKILEGAAGLIAKRQIPFVFTEITFEDIETQQQFGPLHRYLTSHGYHLCGFYEPYIKDTRLIFCNALYLQPAAHSA